jgi:exodeoxyribonuclease-3
MKIISWNVNGLRSVLGKGLSDFILKEEPEILCIQEIKCNLGEFMEEEFRKLGYSIAYNPAIKPGYSGTLTAWKNNLEVEVMDPGEIALSGVFYDEGRITIVKVGDYKIINFYVPSGTSSEDRHDLKLKFLEEFKSHLDGLTESNLIVCGDFNVCHKEIDIHHPVEARKRNLSGFRDDEREKLSNIIGEHLVDIYREHNPETQEFSWWSYRAGSRKKNLGWRIDYFLVSKPVAPKIGRARILTEVAGSDHRPLMVSLG